MAEYMDVREKLVKILEEPCGRCGMNECESCIHYPPSAADGKPCCFCDPIDPLLNCYQRKDESCE